VYAANTEKAFLKKILDPSKAASPDDTFLKYAADFMLFKLVLLGLVFSAPITRLAGKNVSEMTYFVSSWT